MKAALFRQHGGPEVLEIAEVSDPVPGPGEVLVRVRAAALNHLDVWLRRGLPTMMVPLPHIGGGDVCGVAAALGAGAKGGKEGDRVVVNPGISCGRCLRCLSGDDNLCPAYHLVGEQRWGGQAELLVVPVANIAAAPDGPSDAELAALPIAYMTVWHMLVDKARLRMGETVLVLGAGAGVGVAAVQIAKLHGATVIAAASSAAKLERARALGADDTIDYAAEDLGAALKRLVGRRGVDVVVEHTGSPTFAAVVKACAKGARIVTCGATGGHEVSLDLRYVFWRQLQILGSTMAPKGRLLQLLELVAARRLVPVVDRIIPLEQVAAAHRALESRTVFGKIVLTISST